MSDPIMETDNLEANVGNTGEKEKIEQEAAAGEITPTIQTKDFGDGGAVAASSVEPLVIEIMSSEVNLSQNISTSSKSSKRKRKNRRRKHKKNAAAAAAPASESNEASTLDLSQNSEDGKCEDTGTGTDGDLEPSGPEHTDLPNQPSITVTTVEAKSSTEVGENSAVDGEKKNDPSDGWKPSRPTHSVQTLLQIAKHRVMTGIFKPPTESFSENEFEYNSDTPEFSGMEMEDTDLDMAVPPCSPSSVHNIIQVDFADKSESKHAMIDRRKSSTRAVHFDERPPQVCSLILGPHPDPVLKLESLMEAMSELQKAQESLKTEKVPSRTSEDTVVLIEAVQSQTSSVGFGSVASCESAASLLKGDSSSDDVVQENVITYHFPSREELDDEPSAVITHSHNAISSESFFETIEVFKQHNPEETVHLGDDSSRDKAEKEDKDGQGCNCAKLCIIT